MPESKGQKVSGPMRAIAAKGFSVGGLILFISLALLSQPSHPVERVTVEVVAVIKGDEFMGRLKVPGGLFFDEAKKRLYVSDTGNGRLVSFDHEYKYLAELSHEAFSLPAGLVKDSLGRFFVIDSARQEILLVDTEKELIEPLPIKGIPERNERFLPGRIAIDGAGRLYITDRLNRRLVVTDTSGGFIREITVDDEDFFGFFDVKVDGDGNIYAVDAIGKTVYVFDSEGRIVSSFAPKGELLFPTSLAVGRNGFIYVADQHGDRIYVYDRNGLLQYVISESGAKEGELTYPSYLFIDNDGRIYVIDGDRVQVFDEQKG